MFYYQTFVNDSSFKGSEPLTYSSNKQLDLGSIVTIELKKKLVIGFLARQTRPPDFATKPIRKVFDLPPLPRTSLQLASWMLTYYPSSVGATTQQFLPKKLPDSPISSRRSEGVSKQPLALPDLTAEQERAIKGVDGAGTYLLHGETASGKTRVYMELAAKTLAQGRNAVILTPEIGLTPQLTLNFARAFGDASVLVTHSQLTEKARVEVWLKIIHETSPLIVIGPRSALFSPLTNVGLIVLDESHEPSYKQDQLPHYHAGKVAAQLASLHHAALVLGSATPSVCDYFLAKQKSRPILRMKDPATTAVHNTTNVLVVDIKNRSQFSRDRHISDRLLSAIDKALASRQQSLLFLNRRGTARAILCENCAWQAVCPRCNLPLTYHGDTYVLRCHTCGFKAPTVSSCPVCRNPNVLLRSIGTKAVVDKITSIYPDSRIQRFDNDNNRSERLEQHYDSVFSGEVDILVGTQVLAKGLDLPQLGLVGVIAADSSLTFPDYTSQERTYQLLRQVMGRVGRGHQRNSTIIVQTYAPENPALQAAVKGDWQTFYDSEIEQRQKFMFPPFCFLLKLSCRRASPKSCQQVAGALVQKLCSEKLRIIIDGPVPAFQEKIGTKLYQWQLVIKSKDRKELLKVISLLPSGWSYDIDPLNLL